jgi:hypothetical protein
LQIDCQNAGGTPVVNASGVFIRCEYGAGGGSPGGSQANIQLQIDCQNAGGTPVVNASGVFIRCEYGAGGGRGFVSPPVAQPCDTGLPPDEYAACIAAASSGGSGSGGSGGGGSGGSGGSGSGGSISIANPLQSTTILEFLGKIIDVLLIFALPIIVFFIIFAGFKFVTARGNESEITTAKTALTWAVVGGVIILGAKLIITVIQGTISVL